MRKVFPPACLLILLPLFFALPARAAQTLTITSLADDGGAGELRAAIAQANTDNDGDTINFESGLTGTITLTSNLPELNASLTIEGPASEAIVVDGAAQYRPFVVYAPGDTVSITNLTIQNGSDQSDNAGGGGIIVTGGTLLLTACTITGNSGFIGGGISNEATAILTNCTIYGNTAATQGGGMSGVITSQLTNCTISENSASGGVGGIHIQGTGTITNCIIYGDSGGEVDGTGDTLSYCDVEGGFTGTGNIEADPLLGPLAANGGPTDTMALGAGSPCYGAGTATGAPSTDQRGFTRPNPPSIGAYDVGPTLIVTNTNDSGDGSLRSAMLTANVDSDSTITFMDGLSGVITLASALPTITMGMIITGPGESTIAVDGATQWRPFDIDATGDTVSISGLTVQNGNNEGETEGGGAIIVEAGNLMLDDVSFANNTTTVRSGGAIDCYGTMTVQDCSFTGNSATNGGGGAVIVQSSTSVGVLENCTLSSNSSFGNGGGAIFNNGTLTITGCSLTSNSTADTYPDGGAIENNYGQLTAEDCTIAGNSATDYGGAVLDISGTSTITNCTLTNNTATYGGALSNGYGGYSGGAVTLTNCVLYGDTAASEIYIKSGTVAVTYSDIQGGYTGSGNFNANPLLAALGNYGGAAETMALLPGSPCLGAGNAVSGVTTDQRGVAVPQSGRYDIGAFESQGFLVSITGGNNQTSPTDTAFSEPLAVTVTANDPVEPVEGGVVTFSAPAIGASATISGSPATIDAGGNASVTATANGTLGSYTVEAATNPGAASFNLTNGYNGPRIVQIQNASGNAGGTVVIPVTIVAAGNENAVAGSLTFDTSVLTFSSASVGTGAPGSTLELNTTQTASGSLGFALAMPSGQALTAGTDQILTVTFNVAVGASAGTTLVGWANQPAAEQVVDAQSDVLGATFDGGTVTTPVPCYEGDVLDHGSVDLSDWVEVGRIIVGLDPQPTGLAYQAADCSPRGTLGSGETVGLGDWVQTGRYLVGLDPPTPVGGPTAVADQQALMQARRRI